MVSTPLFPAHAILALVAAAAFSAPTPIPLPPFATPFGSSTAHDINNRGDIVGTHADVGAYILSARGLTTFGAAQALSIATGINDRGDTVGVYDDLGTTRGFLRSRRGTFVAVDVPGALRTVPNDLTNQLEIVGYFVEVLPNTDEQVHGFVRSGDVVRVLDNPFGEFHTAAASINEAGTIVGWFGGDQDSPKHGFILEGESWTVVDYPDADSTWLTGIASNGAIVGYAMLPEATSERGFVYRDGVFTDLPPGFIPQGINASGTIVGGDFQIALCVSPQRGRRCP